MATFNIDEKNTTAILPPYFITNDQINFSFTKRSEEFILSPGVYKITLNGAAGGDTSQSGGTGGIVVATFTNYDWVKCYINCGGKGETATSAGVDGVIEVAGGWNGGGGGILRGTSSTDFTKVAGGGGATDFRIGGNTKFHRAMVAGGGGAGGCQHKTATVYTGGAAGTTGSGNAGTGTYGGTGGSQTAAGSSKSHSTYSGGNTYTAFFGVGGDAASNTGITNCAMCGGGGGWFGGGAGTYTSGGGGGSSYILTHSFWVQSRTTWIDYLLSPSMFSFSQNSVSRGNTGNGSATILCTESYVDQAMFVK